MIKTFTSFHLNVNVFLHCYIMRGGDIFQRFLDIAVRSNWCIYFTQRRNPDQRLDPMLIFHLSVSPGNITNNGSMLTLSDPEYDPTFVPLFLDNIDALFGNNTALKNKAIEVCGGTTSFTCLFDVKLTGDENAAKEAQASLKTFETDKKKLGEFFHRLLRPILRLNLIYSLLLILVLCCSSLLFLQRRSFGFVAHLCSSLLLSSLCPSIALSGVRLCFRCLSFLCCFVVFCVAHLCFVLFVSSLCPSIVLYDMRLCFLLFVFPPCCIVVFGLCYLYLSVFARLCFLLPLPGLCCSSLLAC